MTRYWFHSGREEAFALEVPPPDGTDVTEIDEATYKEIVAAQPAPPPPPPKPTRTVEDLERAWRKWDDDIAKLKEQIAEIEAKQKKFGAVVQTQMTLLKVDRLGNFERKQETHINAADWGAIWPWVFENAQQEMIQKRIKKADVLKWADAHGGQLPPGMDRYTEYKLSLKKPPGRKALPVDNEGAN